MLARTRFLWKVFLWLNWVFILYFWWQGSGLAFGGGVAAILIAIGRLLGLVGTFLILQQFFFVGRLPWLERAFGLDRLVRWHHTSGKYGLVAILLHPVFLTLGYAMAANTGVITQYLHFLTDYEDVFNAFIAIILFTIVVVLSLYIVRKRLKYETWYYVHLMVYAAVLLMFGHQFTNGGDLLVSKIFYGYWAALYIVILGLHVVYRFIRPVYRFYQQRFTVVRVVRETDAVTSLYIQGRDLSKFSIEAGQFMFLYIFAPGMWWQKHPFSLSMLPHDNMLRVSIKNSGDFTSMIPNVKVGTRVMIDGPYGIFSMRARVKTKALLIAGGIGITPLRSLFEQMLRDKVDAVMLYGNRTREDIVFETELDELTARYQGHGRVVHILSDDAQYEGERGRIEAEKIKRLVPDFVDRDIFLCGPVPMMEALETILFDLGVKREQIHYEKFSLP